MSTHPTKYKQSLEDEKKKEDKKRGQPRVLQNMLRAGVEGVLEQVHVRVARFQIKNGIAERHHNSEDLTALLQEATRLPPNGYVSVGRHKLARIERQTFADFVLNVRKLVANAREIFIKHGNRDDPNFKYSFATIGHDGWESTLRSFYGVSLFFINPVSWELERLALGLARPASHSDEDCKAAIMTVAERYGIVPNDLFRASNDTASAAVAISRELVGEEGDCKMHVISLAIEHAIGKRTRTKSKQIVDSFEPVELIRRKGRALIKYITSKKAKKRWDNYVALNEAMGHKVIRLPLDNDTRVNGTQRMFQALLRSFYCFRMYFAQETSVASIGLSLEEWKLVAEIEALCRAAYVEGGVPWDAMQAFTRLPKRRMTTSEAEATDDMPLMSPIARQLQERLKKEFISYLPPPDDDELVAMATHPVMASVGREFMSNISSEQAQIWKRAQVLLMKVLYNFIPTVTFDENDPEQATEAHPAGEDGDDEEDDEDDLFTRHSSVSGVSEGNVVFIPSKKSPLDSATEEFEAWTNLVVDWKAILIEQGSQGVKARNLRNPFYLYKQIDVLVWWRRNATKFPYISRVALRYLAKPNSNAYQERVFSFAKFVDNPLRRRMGDMKFEMFVILAKNSDWIESYTTLRRADAKKKKKVLQSFFGVDDVHEFIESEDGEEEEDEGGSSKKQKLKHTNCEDSCTDDRRRPLLIHAEVKKRI
ncbi:hypothetical protein BSKO_14099 [Bryopsis sp. KO-2023]|nr:hypothetical protein BSKO_14099 [Bryopsis sp. KO-2023]